jgi:hypothetical protein
MTDNIVAGPAGHITAHDPGYFSAGDSGHTETGAPGEVYILPATQGFFSDPATGPFEVLDATKATFDTDATQGIIPESVTGVIVHLVG